MMSCDTTERGRHFRPPCDALSGLRPIARLVSQGVALGYLVAALQAAKIVRPSAKRNRFSSTADYNCRARRAKTCQPRATPWECKQMCDAVALKGQNRGVIRRSCFPLCWNSRTPLKQSLGTGCKKILTSMLQRKKAAAGDSIAMPSPCLNDEPPLEPTDAIKTL